MNAIRRPFLALAALALAAAFAAPALATDYDPSKLTIPALNPIPKVTPERTVLKNGLVLYLLEDHTLPRVYGQMYLRASTTWAPADKAGLGGLTAEVMRTGGSAAKSGDAMDDRLAAIGANLYSDMNADAAYTGFYCMAENTGEVLGMLAEVLRRPAFPDDKVELSKVGIRREIASRNDELGSVLNRVATASVFGKDSPYARIAEYATVEAITRDDCVKFHRMCYSPDRAILVVYGDFKGADMKKLVAGAFGDWQKSATAPPAMPAMPGPQKSRLVFAPKDDVTQSGVLLAHLGFKNDDPQVADLDVLEQALGGGFQSRLFNKIRTQRGLAYAAGASAGGGFFRPGVFTAYTLTRNDSVLTAMGLVREEIERATKEPFTEQEVKLARESVENALVFQFERPSNVVFRAAYYELAGYPQDYLQKYQAALAKVTPQTMLAAAKGHVHPDQMVTILVGKEKEFEKPLESLGVPLERFDITIPPPPSKVKAGAGSASDFEAGGGWLKKAAELNGGSAAWSAIKSWHQASSAQLTMQGQSLALGIDVQWALPDKLVMSQKLPMGEMTQGYDGQNGWRKGFGQLADQPDMAETVAENFERSFFHLFGRPEELQVQALPEKKTIDGVEYRVALVKSEKIRDWQLFFAPDGQLARMEYLDKGPQGEVTFTSIFSDWRKVDAIRYPWSNKILMGGQPFMETTVTEATMNGAIAEDAFRKPAN